MIVSYAEQLVEIAEDAGVDLMRAVRLAEVPDSTYYRSIKGGRSLRLSTAGKIADAIERLAKKSS
jgi:predicted transcriptional regulator